jgi:hypothetical protein
MNYKDFFEQLMENFKVPETLEEAIAYINKDPSMQSLVEEMAFRQVVVNILVAANIITEKDFNDSVAHFKKLFTKSFAQELLDKIDDFNEKFPPEKTDDEEEDEWDNEGRTCAECGREIESGGVDIYTDDEGHTLCESCFDALNAA